MQINGAAGIRNDVSSERFGTGDLLSGINIDIDETGKVFRRLGVTQLSAGSATSLFAAPHAMYYVRGGSLYETDLVGTKTLLSGIGTNVCYHELNGKVFWSDGSKNGLIESGTSRMWGHEVPPSTYTAATTSGDLLAGTYGVTVLYVRNGVEGGAGRSKFVDVPDSGAVALTDLPVPIDTTITSKRIYMTLANGAEHYLVADVAPAATTVVIRATPETSQVLRTQFMSAMPSGSQIAMYAGRMYIVDGNIVWYSEPYEYELCDRRFNFLQFPSTVTVFAPVGDGVFVSTENDISFLKGREPKEFDTTVVSQVGGVRGTLVYPEPSRVLKDGVQDVAALWATTNGIVAGLTGGQLMNLTSGRYVMPEVRKGAGLLKIRSGTPQYVVTLSK